MLSPFYTAAHVDAAVAVRATDESDVNGQSLVVYATDSSDDMHPRVVELTDLPAAGNADDVKYFVGISLEGFSRGQLGTVQIGGVANVQLKLADRDAILLCGTLLYPTWSSGISASGVALTDTPDNDQLRPVARVHHHEQHSNIAQARLLHGTQYTGMTKIALQPIQESFANLEPVEVNFAAVAEQGNRNPKGGTKRKRKGGFPPSIAEGVAQTMSDRKPGEFSNFFD